MTYGAFSPPSVSWVDSEPGWADAMQEVRCLRRRSRKRWPVVLLLTCLLTGVVAIYVSRLQRSFDATIVMSVTEENLDPDTALPTPRELQQHIMQVALSHQALLAIAREFGLYREKQRLDPGWTEQLMRDAIEVNVFENELESAVLGNSARSARIAVSFSAPEPELALNVVRYVGAVIENKQKGERQAMSISIARNASDGVELLQQELVRLYRRQAELGLQRQTGATRSVTDVELQRIRAGIEQTERDLSTYEARALALHLRSDFESQEHGLRFETIDPGEIAKVTLTDRQRVSLYTIGAFLFLLPLVSLAIGSFDSRVRDSNGVRRLDLLPLGEVQPFEGMECGAWTRRKAALRGTT